MLENRPSQEHIAQVWWIPGKAGDPGECKPLTCLYIVIQCMTTPHSHQRQPTSDP